ncbi:hypothetical protein [Rubritepida flocculans]|uniref:hypothetical protein n=1 Tax=Rubritepida flocculans TaxID=182403 RepID=UPI00048413EA|nr:hypothetical protein [Rubritepida flocculans]
MSATTTHITVRVPLRIRRRAGRKTLVTPVVQEGAAAAVRTRTDPALMKALARAFRYQRLLDEGRYASITEMAEAEKIDRGYLGRILRLALLAPDVVEHVLDGAGIPEPFAGRLLEAVPADWKQQRVIIGMSRDAQSE